MRLGVNVDHVATLRQARGTLYPDPVVAAMLAEYGGANSIVVHLREDRRHIRERDVILIKEIIKIPLNLEMSVNKDIVKFVLGLRPYQATLVPERRQELTTEGGIDLRKDYSRIKKVVEELKSCGVRVSLFIDPLKVQVDLARKTAADMVELNTGRFSEEKNSAGRKRMRQRIKEVAHYAKTRGFFVAAGHGLDYENVKEIAALKDIEELNIGHSIVSRAVFVGMVGAVEEMLGLISSEK